MDQAEKSELDGVADGGKFLAELMAKAHGLRADKLLARDSQLAIPTVILTAIGSGLAFASFSNIGISDKVAILVVGIISLVATVLSSLRSYCDFSSKATNHTKSAIQFHSLSQKIALLKLRNLPDRDAFVKSWSEIQSEYTAIHSQSLRVPVNDQNLLIPSVPGKSGGASIGGGNITFTSPGGGTIPGGGISTGGGFSSGGRSF